MLFCKTLVLCVYVLDYSTMVVFTNGSLTKSLGKHWCPLLLLGADYFMHFLLFVMHLKLKHTTTTTVTKTGDMVGVGPGTEVRKSENNNPGQCRFL